MKQLRLPFIVLPLSLALACASGTPPSGGDPAPAPDNPPAQPTAEPAPASTPAAAEQPVAGAVSDDGRVKVEAPLRGQALKGEVAVKGVALVWGNRVHLRLIDGKGQMLVEAFADARPADIGQPGPFEGKIAVPAAAQGEATLEVMGHSAADGAPVSVVKIPVSLGG